MTDADAAFDNGPTGQQTNSVEAELTRAVVVLANELKEVAARLSIHHAAYYGEMVERIDGLVARLGELPV